MWKAYLLNSLQSVSWPQVPLPALPIQVRGATSIRLIPHPGEFDFAALVFQTIRYEPEVIAFLSSRQYDTVIAIGANVGLYSILLSRLNPTARVYAFEPSRKAYRRLLENVAANASGNIETFNCAVASFSGFVEFVEFFEPQGHLTNGSLRRDFASAFSEEVETSRVVVIDGGMVESLIEGGKRVLIKIDAEGMEPAILSALLPVIHKYKPDMVVEVLETSVEALNALPLLSGDYLIANITASGLRRVDRFGAFPHRDFAVLPSSLENYQSVSGTDARVSS